MSKIQKRFQIILSIVIISSIMCNLPGDNQSPVEEAISPPEAIEIVKEETITEGVDAFAVNLTAHLETGELLALVQANGYTTYVEGGEYEFSNGDKVQAVSLTDGTSAAILTQIEKQPGGIDAAVYEFIDENTVFIWDQSGGIEITISEDGQMNYILRDSDGNPLSLTKSLGNPQYKVSRILPQAVSSCTSGMGDEFVACVNSQPEGAMISKICAVAFIATVAACIAPPFVGCVTFIPSFLLGFSATCGAVAGHYCMREMTDDPPTSEYSEAEETEIFKYCRDGNLFEEKLYQVQVECKDDRLPSPQNLTIFLTSGEAAKEYTCMDCAGQTSKGTIPHAGETAMIECENGCQPLGNGGARCLKEGETPSEPPVGVSTIPVGTYEGTTNLGSMYIEAWGGAVTTNELIATISEDGTVSGSFTSIYDSGWAKPVEWGDPPQSCTTQILITEIGTLSGQINSASGTISIQVDLSHKINRSGCASGTGEETETNDVSATIDIVDDILSGSAPDYLLTFEATKQ